MGLFFLLKVLVTVIGLSKSISCRCSSEYGAKPCPYLPAPPGEYPPCAKPGMTFCEYPLYYPRELVMSLIKKWKYDHYTLLIDETKEHDYYYGDTNYTPPPMYVQSNENYYPEATYGSNPPGASSAYPGDTYSPSISINYTTRGSYGSTNQLINYKYTSNINEPPIQKSYNLPDTSRFNSNAWSKWNARGGKYYQRRKRRSLHKLTSWMNSSNGTEILKRGKRQSGSQGLCRIKTSYIMPRAALNNKGTWMYVVNVPEAEQQYTQLVRSETCASSQCSGLCSLPDGFQSKCEQKFVQKRLIALQAGGNQLYTDVFWFPSCCLCTISS